jgi:hypothetical protein
MANIKSKDMGLVKEIQKVLLDDADFLRILRLSCKFRGGNFNTS